MTSFQATLTTEPPFSETPWRPGEYALRDAWFPVAHTPTLSNCALHRTVHSQPYFLWRDDGIVRANNNHPGAPPKRPPSNFTDALGNYPVVNRYGHIWVWYRSEESRVGNEGCRTCRSRVEPSHETKKNKRKKKK